MVATPWYQGCSSCRYQLPEQQVIWSSSEKVNFQRSWPQSQDLDQGFVSQTQLLYQVILWCAIVSPSLLEGRQLHSQCLLPCWAYTCTLPLRSSSDSSWTYLHVFFLHPNHSLEKLLFCFFWPASTRIMKTDIGQWQCQSPPTSS